MSNPRTRWTLISLGIKAAQPGLNQKDLGRIPILVPPREIVEEFTILVKPLFDKIFETAKSINSIEQLIGVMLPKLFSGKM